MNYITVEGFDTWLHIVLYVAFHPFLMVVWGMLLHFVKAEIDKAKAEGRSPAWKGAFPGGLQLTFGGVSALIAYGIMMPSADKMGVISDDVMLTMRGLGFFIGYSCDSIAETVAQRASQTKILGNKEGTP